MENLSELGVQEMDVMDMRYVVGGESLAYHIGYFFGVLVNQVEKISPYSPLR
jgi:hypothetical protein